MKPSGTRIDAVMEAVQSRIASRVYMPGVRLPSVRAQAQAMRLSVSTVVEAYERLAAAGVIAARPGAGFYVAGPAAPLALAADMLDVLAGPPEQHHESTTTVKRSRFEITTHTTITITRGKP